MSAHVELDGADLTPDEAAAWDEVSRSGVLERPHPPAPAIAGDAFQYDLTVRRGGEESTLRFTEFDEPPELVPLVRLLERRADEEAMEKRGGP